MVSDGQTIVAVPQDLAGKSLTDATAALADVGLKPKVAESRYSEDVAKDVVIGIPKGTATKLEKGSTVPLVVSKGPEPRTIPSGLVGASEADATAQLQALQLTPVVVRSFSDTVPKGTVISVLPKAGSQVPRGSQVSLEVSKGPELVAVPSIRGAADIDAAVAILEQAGFQAGSVSGPAAGSPVGTSPAAGSMVRPGSTVNIILG
ncbi:MAG: PASTA domain-containing protein [Acidimicrobiales bacterium]